MRVRGVAAEQRALQRGVVAEHHREGVEREDFAGLDQFVGHRVVRAVGVDARLEPCPGVHQLDEGEALGNAADHGRCRGQCDLVLGNAGLHRFHQRAPADGAHVGALADQHMLLGRLDGAKRHGGGRAVDKLDTREMLFQQHLQIEVHLVELDAKALDAGKQVLQRSEIAVAAPVGIGDVVADRPPPGLAAVDRRRHGGHAVAGQDRAVAPPELAIEEAGEIADIVIGGEQAGIDAGLFHARLHGVAAARHLAVGKG